MADIATCLNKILSAIYGKDVRQAIHDAIHCCYEDGKSGATDLVAREAIEALRTGAIRIGESFGQCNFWDTVNGLISDNVASMDPGTIKMFDLRLKTEVSGAGKLTIHRGYDGSTGGGAASAEMVVSGVGRLFRYGCEAGQTSVLGYTTTEGMYIEKAGYFAQYAADTECIVRHYPVSKDVTYRIAGDAVRFKMGGYPLALFTQSLAIGNTNKGEIIIPGNADNTATDYDVIFTPTYDGYISVAGYTPYNILEVTVVVTDSGTVDSHGWTWTDWEWENPPMVADVEYRTTERYNGKPVYVIRKHFDELSGTSGSASGTSVAGLSVSTVVGISGVFAYTDGSGPHVCQYPVITSDGAVGVDIDVSPTYIGDEDVDYVGMFISVCPRTQAIANGSADIVIKYTK